jgi:hypothetical protein
MDRERFERIKERHGKYASWAVWADAGSTPKSNMGDMSVLDPDLNPALLGLLHCNSVMVALNFSRPVDGAPPFHNFHPSYSEAQDYKTRYAFAGTRHWGAYMTDIIKNFPMLKSSEVRKHLTAERMRENVDAFLGELADLGADRPTIIAFGADVHKLVAKYVPDSAYSKLVRVRHYADYVRKEQYRAEVAEALA